MQARDRFIVAADLSSRDEILALVDEIAASVGTFKIGLQAFVANGPALVLEIVERGVRVFLDLKIHDIPNTVRHAIAEAVSLGASMTTVHAAGGPQMLESAAEVQQDCLVLAVTVLTSLDSVAVRRIGFDETPAALAVRLALLAREAGLRGVVASPLEIGAVREACGERFVILTPGIRAAGSTADDQARTMTAEAAIRAGADYIVVGRPITGARDRKAAAAATVDAIANGMK